MTQSPTLSPEERRAIDYVPATRADCPTERPCLHVRCRYHLAWELRPPRRGPGKRTWVDWSELRSMAETCTLDIAARGGESLEAVGQALRMTRERIRQIEAVALRKLRWHARRLREAAPDDPPPEYWELLDLGRL